MPFGGFAPLPIRLSQHALEGISADQFKTLTAHLTAVRRTTVSVRFHISGTTVTNYAGENGMGSVAAPTVTVNAPGSVTIEYESPVWEDEFGVMRQIVIRTGKARPTGATREAVLRLIDNQTVRLEMYEVDAADPGIAPAAISATVTLWFDRNPHIGDYGGDPLLEDNKTEGDTPRPWEVFLSLQAMRGDAYSTLRSGLIYAEHLALSRLLAYAGWRQPEERQNNGMGPARASSKLGYWAFLLDVRNSPGDQPWQVRQRCNAKWRLLIGNSRVDTDAAIRELLGDALISIERLDSYELSDPPEPTWWPALNPGPDEIDLGGGAWSSPTSFVSVVVQQPSPMELGEFYRLMDVDYFSLMDTVLPAWATFGWGTSDGFLLDIDQLDLDAL